jgi:hypothetical protein
MPSSNVGAGLFNLNTAGYGASFVWSTVAPHHLDVLVEGSNGANLTWTTSTAAFTGTSGADGTWNNRIETDANLFWLENRLGGSVQYTVVLFGAS